MEDTQQFALTLDDQGQVLLPAALRQQLDLRPGDRLIVTLDSEGNMRVVLAREQARRLRGLYRDLASGRSLADDLISDRRHEALQEDRQ